MNEPHFCLHPPHLTVPSWAFLSQQGVHVVISLTPSAYDAQKAFSVHFFMKSLSASQPHQSSFTLTALVHSHSKHKQGKDEDRTYVIGFERILFGCLVVVILVGLFLELRNEPRIFNHWAKSPILDVMNFTSILFYFILCKYQSRKNLSWFLSQQLGGGAEGMGFQRNEIEKEAFQVLWTLSREKYPDTMIQLGLQGHLWNMKMNHEEL